MIAAPRLFDALVVAPAAAGDVLAEQDDVGVGLHGDAHRLVDRLQDREFRALPSSSPVDVDVGRDVDSRSGKGLCCGEAARRPRCSPGRSPSIARRVASSMQPCRNDALLEQVERIARCFAPRRVSSFVR